MDTAEALKQAMKALRDAEIPPELWETALPLALADIRGGIPEPRGSSGDAAASSERTSSKKARTARKGTPRRSTPKATPHDELTVLVNLPDEAALFQKIEAETGVSKTDLADLFHVEAGRVELKVPGPQLGKNTKAATMTIAALSWLVWSSPGRSIGNCPSGRSTIS